MNGRMANKLIAARVENTLFEFWESLPEPKLDYTQWYYGEGGVKESLNRSRKADA